MARITAIVILVLSGILALPGSVSSLDLAHDEPDLAPAGQPGPEQESLTAQQQKLVDLAVGRFEAQGLELPEVEYVFHTDLRPCHGHKGMYYRSTQILEMCSLDLHTMLHELAHAWANETLAETSREAFVQTHGLDSWNDHDHVWERRGTEHVAETIAWALAVDPPHVKWVETGLDEDSTHTTHRMLSIGVDVETLLNNFKEITGMDPIFRHSDEWALEESSSATSPESRGLGG